MAIYKLLKIHPDSVWAKPGHQIEGMVFQTKEKPFPVYTAEPGWVCFTSVFPLNGTNICLDEISICGCKVRRLFK